LERADVLFDFDYSDIEGMKHHAKQVRWIQATSAGIGKFVSKHNLVSLPAVLTTAAGVHGQPLAEFVIWGMLTFIKNYPRARAQQVNHHWQRFHNDDLEGKTLAIIGLGSVGREVARLVRPFGMRVIATKRSIQGVDPQAVGVDALYPINGLATLLEQADVVVAIAPHTAETENLLDEAAFQAMKQHALFINIGRGALVDEDAMMAALRSGKLAGAVLDVARTEPLPAEHALWDMENVFIFPHSASTSKNENRRLTDLFIDNLQRFIAGQELRNVYDPSRGY
jgi:phosphoglycerate dehydrogenase-like enzyme